MGKFFDFFFWILQISWIFLQVISEFWAEKMGPSAIYILNWRLTNRTSLLFIYGLKPKVWGRVGPDPRAELQVDSVRGPQAQGLGRPFLTGWNGWLFWLDSQPKSHPLRFLLVFPKWDTGNTLFLCCITRTDEQSFVWCDIPWQTGI